MVKGRGKHRKVKKLKLNWFNRPSLFLSFALILFLFFGFLTFVLAFSGPTQNPPGGSGVLQVDQYGNFGVAPSITQITPSQGTFGKVFTIASSSNPGFSLFNTAVGRQYTWYVNSSSSLLLWTNTATAGSNIFTIDSAGNVTPGGGLIFGSGFGVSAQSVSAGSFAANTGGGFFGFPSKVSIGYGVGSTPSSIGQGGDLSVSGSVGIGTTSPLTKVHIFGSASGGVPYNDGKGNGRLTIENANRSSIQLLTSNTGDEYIHFGDQDDPNVAYVAYTHSDNKMYFKTNGSNRVVIDSAGNVGIGTTGPISRFHMRADYGDSDLSANMAGFRYETYFNPTVSASTSGGAGTALLQINTPTGVTITSNDNHFSAFRPIVRKFGPGTVTQMIAVGGAWHWVNEGNIDNFYNFFGGNVRQNGGTGTVTNAYGLYLTGLKQPFVTNAYGVYQAGSSDINYFAGNVGIGTTSPGAKLDVNGSLIARSSVTIPLLAPGGIVMADSSGNLYATSTAGATGISGTPNYIPVFTGTSSLGNSVIYQSGSYIGIGTTAPYGVLSISGMGWADQTNAPDSPTLPNTTPVGGLVFDGSYTNGMYRTRFVKIDRGGNLPLYIQESRGTANSFSNIARFGSDSWTNSAFEVMGQADFTGYVGIGTTNPGTNLDVAGNINVGSVLYDRANTNYYLNPSGNIMPYALNSGSVNINGIVNVPYAPTGSVYGIETGGSYALTFQGTQDCSANSFIFQNAYSVKGDCTTPQAFKWVTSHSTFGSRGIGFFYGTSPSSGIIFYADSVPTTAGATFTPTPRMIINNSGNVGIGTTAPNGTLTIYKDNLLSATQGDLLLEHPTSGGASSIVFTSRSNYGSDYGYLTYYDSNSTYAFWGTTGENSALVIGTQNDGMNSVSDVVALRGAAADVFGTNTYPATMIVNDAGNVGIGTTVPGAKLDVNGNVNASIYYDRDNTNYYLDPAANVMPYSAIFAGNVGIGTTNPDQKLTISGATTLKFYANSTGDIASSANIRPHFASGDFNIYEGVPGSGVLRLGINSGGNTYLVPNGGNVGIGTTSPGAKLDVNGSLIARSSVTIPLLAPGGIVMADSSGNLYATSTAGATGISGTTNYIPVFTGTSSLGNSVIYQSGGNVGIGTTSPGEKLTIFEGNLSFTGTTSRLPVIKMTDKDGNAYPVLSRLLTGTVSDIELRSQYSTASGKIFFRAGNSAVGGFDFQTPATDWTTADFTSRFYIAGTGNVGIGTTNPGSYKLYVAGDQYVSGTSTIAGNLNVTGTLSAGTYAMNNISASIYYDKDNTNYYLDPAANVMPYSALFAGNVGIGTITPQAALDISGSYYSRLVVKGNCSGAVTIDWSAGNIQHCVLTGNVTFTFTNGRSGGNYRLILKQDTTGSRTVTWPASVRWGSGVSPTLTATAGKSDYIGFIYNGVDSTYDGIAFNANF